MPVRFTLSLVVLALAGCAAPQGEPPKAAASVAAAPVVPPPAAKSACEPPPTQLVTRDLEPGKDEPIPAGSAILVAYTGWLYDGCKPDRKGIQFDTSEGRPSPFGLVVGGGRVIKGWDEGIVGMRDGGRRLLVIPPDKGYGEKGAGDKIPPNATLVFEVEVIKVLHRPPAAK